MAAVRSWFCVGLVALSAAICHTACAVSHE